MSVLPGAFSAGLRALPLDAVEEVRLRLGQRPTALCGRKETALPGAGSVTADDLRYVLSAATGGSRYSAENTIREGFVTLPGGHRIGVCGTTVTEDGAVRTIRDVSSLCIRAARERLGVGICPTASLLIAGPPGCGKTTFLRDCIRILSEQRRSRVTLIDERGEVAACLHGAPQFHMGPTTDVVSLCPKAVGIPMALRVMNPQWIAVDEITREEDVDALCRGAYCGAMLLATCHVWQGEDLLRRPVYRRLLDANLFREAILLSSDHTWRKLDLEGLK